jgi:hypothetical protein
VREPELGDPRWSTLQLQGLLPRSIGFAPVFIEASSDKKIHMSIVVRLVQALAAPVTLSEDSVTGAKIGLTWVRMQACGEKGRKRQKLQ